VFLPVTIKMPIAIAKFVVVVVRRESAVETERLACEMTFS